MFKVNKVALLSICVAALLLASGCSKELSQAEKEQILEDYKNEHYSASADLGDYEVEIKSVKQAVDHNGDSVIVVTYSWTNNSSDTRSAMTSLSCTAYQNGVSLDPAYGLDDSVYDSGLQMRDIKPGVTIDVQDAFLLDGDSTVEIEIQEWLTWDDNPPFAYMEFQPS